MQSWRKYIPHALIFATLVAPVFIYSKVYSLEHENHHLKFALLDIGQGDALYIEAPNGNKVLVDGGPPHSLLAPLSQMMSFGDKDINAIVVTNPDADHYAGFIDLLKNYNVGAVIEPGTVSKTKTYATFENLVAEKKIPDVMARKGMKIILDEKAGVEIEILFPDRNVSNWNSNDGSLVAKLIYKNTSVMLTGDATKKTEGIVLQNNSKEILKSDILKVGHHGSRTSTSEAFVSAVAPEFAGISDGENNSYGHPHKETLDTLNKYGVKIYRTDLVGTVIFESDGERWWVR